VAHLNDSQTSEYVKSYYAGSTNVAPLRESLQQNICAETCVIGGGFSGLSSALHLAEKGYQVVLLETSRIGWGASGRNGGQIVNGFSRDLIDIEKRYGVDSARAIGEMSLEGGNIIRQRIEKYEIQCDLRAGNVFAAFTTSQICGPEAIQRNWQQHGHQNLELLDRTDIRQLASTDLYAGGLLDRQGGHILPFNLCLGEAAAFESLGGSIYEKTAVTGIDSGVDKRLVRSLEGSVSADKVVVCGNAYLGNVVPQISNKIMPVSTQIVTTEVLGEDVCHELMPAQTCIEDTNLYARLLSNDCGSPVIVWWRLNLRVPNPQISSPNYVPIWKNFSAAQWRRHRICLEQQFCVYYDSYSAFRHDRG
jgi:gamma-glutamylputrescine oxidase